MKFAGLTLYLGMAAAIYVAVGAWVPTEKAGGVAVLMQLVPPVPTHFARILRMSVSFFAFDGYDPTDLTNYLG